ncbi:MAG: PKD domain-containing protein [Candidatus Hydrogenedentes bacterium]|nr:PKD domain-containing protein [Candidatus Hydrogenedentota bacterium]
MSRCLGRLSFFIAAVILASTTLTGCLQDSTGVGLVVTPDALHFDLDEDTLALLVTKNLTNDPFHPVVVASSASWVQAENCQDESDNCISDHPLFPLRIPIHIDRTKTQLGTNRAVLILKSLGATFAEIEVVAEDLLQVDFESSTRRVAAGTPLSFTDTTEKTDAAGDVIARLWDFGDGSTSTATDPFHAYASPGIYPISLTITTDSIEETITKEAFVTVSGGDTEVDFVASQTNIFEGESVTFEDISVTPEGPITARRWDFGDDRFSTDARPTHLYAQAGIYTVSLTITTPAGDRTVTKEDLVIVQRKIPPVADFTLSPFPPVALADTRLFDLSDPGTAPIAQWVWEFEDGSFTTEQNPVHRFSALGMTDVKLTVSSAHGTSSKTISLNVTGIPPTANFAVNDTTPIAGQAVQFTNQSVAGSAPIQQTIWEFGDGGSSTLANPTHAYQDSGVFVARLTVITAHGNDAHTVTITVSFLAPTAAFSANERFPDEGGTVQFTDLSLGGTLPVSQWLWNFGDPASGTRNTDTRKNPTHRYDTAGLYTVTLTVTTLTASNNTGTHTETGFINVIRPPVAGFTAATPNASDPATVRFTNTTVRGTQTLIAYQWNFGDPGSGANNVSTAVSPNHVFSAPGTFTVTLVASTQSPARESTFQAQVNVAFDPPVLDFTVETNEDTPRVNIEGTGAITDEEYFFRNLTEFGTETGFSVEWDFGDPDSGAGNTSTDFDAVHTFSGPGTYTVTLRGFPQTGEVAVTQDIVVDAAPIPDFSAQPLVGAVQESIQFQDTSMTDGRRPITGRLWRFTNTSNGQSSISTSAMPSPRFATPGLYTVSLTVNFTHSAFDTPLSATEVKTGYLQIIAN